MLLAAKKVVFMRLKAPVRRVACLDIPTPAGYVLEDKFYAGKADIISCCREVVSFT